MTEPATYQNRREAGQILAAAVRKHVEADHPVIFALPRGGVPIGYALAHALGAPLDILAVRKLGMPGQPEFAIGAIAIDGSEVLDEKLVSELGLSRLQIGAIADRGVLELRRQDELYHARRAPIDARDRTGRMVG